ncbi:hypothetical protein PFISCL1PPCAC_2503, partial [Pristionchus fissidentatus]
TKSCRGRKRIDSSTVWSDIDEDTVSQLQKAADASDENNEILDVLKEKREVNNVRPGRKRKGLMSEKIDNKKTKKITADDIWSDIDEDTKSDDASKKRNEKLAEPKEKKEVKNIRSLLNRRGSMNKKINRKITVRDLWSDMEDEDTKSADESKDYKEELDESKEKKKKVKKSSGRKRRIKKEKIDDKKKKRVTVRDIWSDMDEDTTPADVSKEYNEKEKAEDPNDDTRDTVDDAIVKEDTVFQSKLAKLPSTVAESTTEIDVNVLDNSIEEGELVDD